jgi:hypothetical protein
MWWTRRRWRVRCVRRAIFRERTRRAGRTAFVAYGKTVWFRHPLPVPSCRWRHRSNRIRSAIKPTATVTRRIRSSGSARYKPQSHCAGNAGLLPLNLYARVRSCLCILHARPRVQRAPGIPCSLFRGTTKRKPRAKSCRESADVYLLFEIGIRNVSTSLRAQRSNPFSPSKESMDCFAALAMTLIDRAHHAQ